LDLRLPGKDGIEILRVAKQQRPQLQGIIITAYPTVQTAIEAIKQGAVEYLEKPFDLNQLEKLIRQTLGPVQMEIKPKVTGTSVVPVVERDETTIKVESISERIKQGKTHLEVDAIKKHCKSSSIF